MHAALPIRCEEAGLPAALPQSFAVTADATSGLEKRLAELRFEQDALQRSLYEAAQVQRNLCGSRHLRHSNFEIVSEIFPVRHLSGDFISVTAQGDDIVMAIGDIGGKGLAAAMWFTYVIGLVRAHSATGQDPATTLADMNRDFCLMNSAIPVTTLFLARLSASGEVRYCNAGHPPAILFRADGTVASLLEGGPVLGVLRGARYESGAVSLSPGETLVGYSDGIEECRNHAGTEFGTERIVGSAQGQLSSASGLLFSLLGAVEDFAGDRSREDDLALTVVRRMEN